MCVGIVIISGRVMVAGLGFGWELSRGMWMGLSYWFSYDSYARVVWWVGVSGGASAVCGGADVLGVVGASDWGVFFTRPGVEAANTPIRRQAELRIWMEGHSSLLAVMRWR